MVLSKINNPNPILKGVRFAGLLFRAPRKGTALYRAVPEKDSLTNGGACQSTPRRYLGDRYTQAAITTAGVMRGKGRNTPAVIIKIHL